MVNNVDTNSQVGTADTTADTTGEWTTVSRKRKAVRKEVEPATPPPEQKPAQKPRCQWPQKALTFEESIQGPLPAWYKPPAWDVHPKRLNKLNKKR